MGSMWHVIRASTDAITFRLLLGLICEYRGILKCLNKLKGNCMLQDRWIYKFQRC